MRRVNGQFEKGFRASPETELKPGEHWRPRRAHWDREWMRERYEDRNMSASAIGSEAGLSIPAVYHWLKKHGIKRRNTSEVRAVKKWGASGDRNPMFGKRGTLHPNWRGGTTPLRQRVYSSSQWQTVSRKIRERDKHCKLCGEDKLRCEIHHIDRVVDAPHLILVEDNLILLCERCHSKITGKEKQWKPKLLKLLNSERRKTKC